MTESQFNSCCPDLQEEWRVVIDYPNYEVSSLGRVRRRFARKGWPAGYILNPGDSDDYLHVGLRGESKVKYIYVHRLVAMAFLEAPAPERTQVNHKDGNKSHNHLPNLEWTTPLENHRHAIEVLEHHKKGERHPAAKFTGDQVKQVFDLRMAGESPRNIAKLFDVTEGCIYAILERKNWAHLAMDVELPSIRGKRSKGSNNGMAKITETTVREIKKLLAEGITGREIARRTGTHPQTVSNIKTGKGWAHVE